MAQGIHLGAGVVVELIDLLECGIGCVDAALGPDEKWRKQTRRRMQEAIALLKLTEDVKPEATAQP